MKNILVFLMLGVMLSALQELRYPSGYRVNGSRVFYTYIELTEIDMTTFEILNERYAKDKNAVYYEGKVIVNVDPEDFELLGVFFRKD